MQEQEITVWLNQIAHQPESGMRQIWNVYYERLISFARRKLKDMPRRHLDEEDIATDAMNSLFQGIRNGRFPDLQDRDDLWKLLLTITARKAGKAIRGNLADKRGGGDVRGESVFAVDPNSGNVGIGNVSGKEPSPAFVDQLVSQFDDLFDCLDDELLRTIALKKLEGFTNDEIANELDCAVRTVERKLQRIRMQWGLDK